MEKIILLKDYCELSEIRHWAEQFFTGSTVADDILHDLVNSSYPGSVSLVEPPQKLVNELIEYFKNCEVYVDDDE